MKTNLIIVIALIISSYAWGQERLASKVNFQSGKETIEGILIRPNNNDNTPAVVFQQGSGNHSFI